MRERAVSTEGRLVMLKFSTVYVVAVGAMLYCFLINGTVSTLIIAVVFGLIGWSVATYSPGPGFSSYYRDSMNRYSNPMIAVLGFDSLGGS